MYIFNDIVYCNLYVWLCATWAPRKNSASALNGAVVV